MASYEIHLQVALISVVVDGIEQVIAKQNREHRDEQSNEKIMERIQKGKNELESLRRQAIVDRMYSTNNSIHRLPIFQDAVKQSTSKST